MEETSLKFTPFFGGKESSGTQVQALGQFQSSAGAYCSLLEIGDTRVLLDCGCLSTFNEEKINQFRDDVCDALDGKSLDCILISHADLGHVGALPYLCGKNGPFPGTPVVCTLPVLKMSHMVLYDYYLRLKSEGTRLKSRQSGDNTPGERAASMLRNATGVELTLDDVDESLEHARMVKFGQRVEIVLSNDCDGAGKSRFFTLCAHPSGRTVGGTSWVIRQGTTEVLYMVDINLRKELTVDGAPIERLPTSPSLMIVESGHDTSSLEKVGKKERKKEEGSLLASLLSGVMDTVRLEGSVLIPIETVGRTLELIYILGKFWEEKKLGGMYHLVFLSPMAHNIIEYAKSQLEWMPDTLSKDFYLGRSNPFSLAHLNTCSTVAEVMALGTGPKVVLATDASLSGGLSKELLLRWGGNPSCRVIFTDRSEPATLGAEIRELIATSAKQNAAKGPIIVTVNSAERVLLTGDELETYIRLKEEDHRRLEELEHRHLREKELTTLIGGGTDESGSPIRLDNGEDLDADTSDESDDGSEFEVDVNGDHEAYVPEEASLAVGKKRRQKDRSIQNGTKKTKSIGRIAQYATPRFQMFETRELRQLPDCMDEYGLDNSDLNFTEIVTSTTLVPKYGKVHRGKDVVEAKGTLAVTSQGVTEEMLHGDEDDEIDPNAPPSKVVSTPTRVQLTCTFKEIAPAAWGRLDFKGVKTLINKCAPKHLILLHGTNNISHSSASGHIRGLSHVNKVVEYASKSIGASRVFAPEVNQIVHLQIPTERFRVIVSEHNLVKGSRLPKNPGPGMQMLAIPPSSSGVGASSSCSIGTFSGNLAALTQYDRSIFSDMSLHDGIITTKWIENEQKLDESVNVVVESEKLLEESTHEAPGQVAIDEAETGGSVDDWARQYQESLNRNKQLEGDEVSNNDEITGDEIVDNTNATEEDDEDAFFAEEYDYEDDVGYGDHDEDEETGYRGNSDLYDSSFMSGDLLSKESSRAGGLRVGSISAGEVQLQTLQQELETEGITVEYKLGQAGAGAMLLCGGQVIIRKMNENNFIVEGPPCKALYVAKRVVYKRFSFL